jgi:hypothetical protein
MLRSVAHSHHLPCHYLSKLLIRSSRQNLYCVPLLTARGSSSAIFKYLSLCLCKMRPFVPTLAFAAIAASQNACDTGDLMCCDSVVGADSQTVQSLLGTLDIKLDAVTGLVGINCKLQQISMQLIKI